jgi:DNA-binding CsgD family transcriptional regulator
LNFITNKKAAGVARSASILCRLKIARVAASKCASVRKGVAEQMALAEGDVVEIRSYRGNPSNLHRRPRRARAAAAEADNDTALGASSAEGDAAVSADIPVPEDARGPLSTAIIDIIRLRNLPAPSETILKHVYGLSPAEVRIAQGISRGDSLEEVAASSGVRISTARTQLASIFEKTNTRRQAKLVALLSHLAYAEL